MCFSAWKDAAESDALGITTTFGYVVFPVVALSILLALGFEDLLIVGVLVGAGSLLLLISSLALKSVSHLNISELLQRHRRQVVARLEHLLLVLLLQAHAVIDVLVAHLDLIDRLVFAHRVDIFLDDVRFFYLIRLVSSWVDHHWQFFDIVGSNVGDLQGWLLVPGNRLAPCLVLGNLSRRQASRML